MVDFYVIYQLTNNCKLMHAVAALNLCQESWLAKKMYIYTCKKIIY